MIKPNKFLDLDSCIINISGEITKILLQRNSIKYNDLYEILKNIYDEGFEYKLLQAIDFLFLLGVLKYSPSTDSLELIRWN